MEEKSGLITVEVKSKKIKTAINEINKVLKTLDHSIVDTDIEFFIKNNEEYDIDQYNLYKQFDNDEKYQFEIYFNTDEKNYPSFVNLLSKQFTIIKEEFVDLNNPIYQEVYSYDKVFEIFDSK